MNIWLILSATAKATLRPLMSDRGYKGPHLKAVKTMRKMAHYRVVERMWKTPTIGGKKRYLFSLNLTAGKKAKEAIDYLLAEYPNQVTVGGAWHWDGRQAGTQWELDASGNKTGNTTGTPTYPINETQLLKFMPDVEGVPATVLTDVNLLQGSQPRRFQT